MFASICICFIFFFLSFSAFFLPFFCLFLPFPPPQSACDCQHFTTGTNCAACQSFYQETAFKRGDAYAANPCTICQCYGHSTSCSYNATIGAGMCLNCADQTTGRNCDTCRAGFFRPVGTALNASSPCQSCSNCTGQGLQSSICVADEFQSGSLSPGTCLCRDGFGGEDCDTCKAGFRLSSTRDSSNNSVCIACNCDSIGATSTACANLDGQCSCHTGYTGLTCNVCATNYYRNSSTNHCQACNCDASNSQSASCDGSSGQCACLAGAEGRQCDTCSATYFRNSTSGRCSACACSEGGSESTSCDGSGQCSCKAGLGLGGLRCDTCTASNTTAVYDLSCQQSSGDVVLLLDASNAAATTSGFQAAMLAFLDKMLQRLSSENGNATRIAAVNVGNSSSVLYGFDDYPVFSTQALVLRLLYRAVAGDAANMGQALSRAAALFSDGSLGARDSSVPKTVVIVTTSNSNDSTTAILGQLAAADVYVRVVAVGEHVNISALLPPASSSSRQSATFVASAASLNSTAADLLALEVAAGVCLDVKSTLLGCTSCACNWAGTAPNTVCDARTGHCQCKSRVEGDRCDRCKSGYAGLDASLSQGCSGVPSGLAAPQLTLDDGNTTVVVQWTAPSDPNGLLTSYTVRRDGTVVFTTTNTSILSYRDNSNIKPGTQYGYTVAAATPAGSVTSATARVQTPEAAPSGLAAPVVARTSPRQLDISWGAPSQPNGIILSYVVQINGSEVYRSIARQTSVSVMPYTTYAVTLYACNSVSCAVAGPVAVTTNADGELLLE